MSDDEPSEMTNDENVTGGDGGVWGDSGDEAADGFGSFTVEEAAGADSVAPLARRSRMTNPCSSSAMFCSLPRSQMVPVPYHRGLLVASRDGD